MLNKKSPYYVKSELSRNLYGNKDSTTFERSLNVVGKDKDHVKNAASMCAK
ncbi:MAG: hypothetical protein GTN36_03970 [Candidatus Aenigmarchaeota archaeon]|nr:hypothetical protein [Candidatus Aenigmarchaeota archaeon]